MRKKLSELTLEEFVRLLCEAEKVYEFEFKVYPIDKDKGFVYKGKYEQMCDFLKSVLADNPDDESTKGALEKLESDFFDYNLQLTKLDIYDYLEEKTKGFQADRCKILLDDMELQKFIIDDERDNLIDSKDDGLCAGYSMLDALSCLNYAYAVRILQEKMGLQTQQPYDKGDVLPDEEVEEIPIAMDAAPKKRGRPRKNFDAVLAGDKEAVKDRLHCLIDGKTGKDAVIYIKTAIELGLILRPTHTQFIEEFGNIASRQIYNKYISGNLYYDGELEGVKQALMNM